MKLLQAKNSQGRLPCPRKLALSPPSRGMLLPWPRGVWFNSALAVNLPEPLLELELEGLPCPNGRLGFPSGTTSEINVITFLYGT